MEKNEKKYVLAIDIGGSKVSVGIVDMSGIILTQSSQKIPNGIKANYKKLFELVFDLVKKLFESGSDLEISAAGVCIPGITDAENGRWVYSPFSGIKDVPVVQILSQKFNIPTFICNDVNASAYAEKIFSKEELNDFLWITVSNGIGGGLVLNGELYEGAFGHAGEIGHMIVVEEGELCGCGNHGCLEAYASGASIAKRYKNIIKYPHKITASEVAELAREGDKAAKEVYDFAGFCLGKAIAMSLNLLNLSKVIIGGGVAASMDLLMPELEKIVGKHIFKSANKRYEIKRTKLGYNAALLGAAAIAQNGIGWRQYD